ncbi:Non-canonical purine NTP pyrophosphatase [uncultured delta proteobacterium]|uniref:dITP/XTP pyrophosphatase n=1 Tax=uncultured delta proteobacterium TaxID=34034 RepID=A0A212JL22_9DELT|nr:Non-canonical purine NTP pyrophosphatase [uncultured delta proteobacterium]
MTPTVVLASRNKGKIKELAVLLQPFGVTVEGLDAFPAVGEIEETGATFAENSLLKAATVSKLTGHIAVADDSGLVVDALGGEPGVYSARYSEEPGRPATDERNTEKVLEKTRDVPDGSRTVRFVSVMAAAAPDGRHILAEGRWEGILARKPSGTNGFGYDPVFFDPETGQTAAQMEPAQKNARSHRAKACQKLLELWPAFWKKTGGQTA